MSKTTENDNYIYAENAVFQPDFLEPTVDEERQKRREKRMTEGAAKKKISEAAKKRRARRRMLYFVVTVILIVSVALASRSIVNLVDLENEKKAREEELNALQQEVEKDKAILEQVNSKEYVEQEARSKFDMIKEGETLYKYSGSDGSN